jgi:hypothetical protein
VTKVTQAAVIIIAAVMLFGRHDVLWAFGAIFAAVSQLFHSVGPIFGLLLGLVLGQYLVLFVVAGVIIVGGMAVRGVRWLARRGATRAV